MSLSRKEIEAIVYRALLEFAEGGTDRARERLAGVAGITDLSTTAKATRSLRSSDQDSEPLSAAVVTAVVQADRFIDARTILDLVRNNAIVSKESDERYRRRKVSLALYAQKGKKLTSVRANDGRFVWGLPEWWDAQADRFHVDREPIDDDGIPHDAANNQ